MLVNASITNTSVQEFSTQRLVTLSTSTKKSLSLTDDERTFFLMKCYVNPSVSMCCLLLNLLSVVIFVRAGLRKPTNVFLFALSFADFMSQAVSLNFAQILRFFGPDKPLPMLKAWQYPYDVSYVLYVCDCLWDFVGYWGMYVQSSIPVIISFERIIAVFWPLHLRKWVSFKTAFAIVLAAYVFWLPWMIYSQTFTGFWFFYDKPYYFSTRGESFYFFQNMPWIIFFNTKIFQNLSSWVPVSLVLAGCVAIALKVKMTLNKRRLLTTNSESKRWSSKTTRALVSVCLFFTVTHGIYCAVVYVFANDIENAKFNTYLAQEYLKFILSVNKVCNFFVYFWSNDHFRNALRNMLNFKVSL
ncbi:G-protein coupled receptor [Biomphalaria pfeifferi]|uniref:G-protein coupled receptor n=1 Tax=Biomphalaria pfeifferi TaxID=112525 RepID=A0AAD8BNV4_BIOPF|nr:G-protein coupled receptor [Biomphalaria pfeifferi]